MVRVFKQIACIAFVFLILISPVNATVNPLERANNKFGIHVLNPDDYAPAAELVNSNGGEWGYVTLVIREDQREENRWQAEFDELRERKLIPIVRLATRFEDGAWIKPRNEDIDPWVDFLNSLNWVTKNRYIVLFNEPNHANEWGGDIDPKEYASIAQKFHQRLKSASDDFFVLPAGLDLAPETTQNTMHPYTYLSEMASADSEIFNMFDGWTSHSYPNPNFSASPYRTGRNSIRGYRWEMTTLRQLGLKKQLPIFITETGWKHSANNSSSSNLSPDQITENFRIAYNEIWTDQQIVAITPFVLNYQDPPFDVFSWKKNQGNEYYPQYQLLKGYPKEAGNPEQLSDSSYIRKFFPEELIVDSQYYISTKFINTGQSIWSGESTSSMINSSLSSESLSIGQIPKTKPFDQAKVWLKIKTPNQPGDQIISFQLTQDGQPFGETVTHSIKILENTPISHFKLWIQKLLHRGEFS